jgi:hypothetical protein
MTLPTRRLAAAMPVPGITSDPDGAQLAWAIVWLGWEVAEYDVALDPYRHHAAQAEFRAAMHAARRWWDERVREERAA